jgi:hypothetical protein
METPLYNPVVVHGAGRGFRVGPTSIYIVRRQLYGRFPSDAQPALASAAAAVRAPHATRGSAPRPFRCSPPRAGGAVTPPSACRRRSGVMAQPPPRRVSPVGQQAERAGQLSALRGQLIDEARGRCEFSVARTTRSDSRRRRRSLRMFGAMPLTASVSSLKRRGQAGDRAPRPAGSSRTPRSIYRSGYQPNPKPSRRRWGDDARHERSASRTVRPWRNQRRLTRTG